MTAYALMMGPNGELIDVVLGIVESCEWSDEFDIPSYLLTTFEADGLRIRPETGEWFDFVRGE